MASGAADDAVVLFSGGLDSATCLWHAAQNHLHVYALHFTYGQKNMNKEGMAVRLLQRDLNGRYLVGPDDRFQEKASMHVYAMPIFGATSAILSGGKGKMDKVQDLIVPGRNAVFLSIAYAFAAQRGARHVYLGAKRSQFPDCQPKFLALMAEALGLGLGAWSPVDLKLPLLGWSRQQTLDYARTLGVPVATTWSCYEGGTVPCGECGACLDRASAI